MSTRGVDAGSIAWDDADAARCEHSGLCAFCTLYPAVDLQPLRRHDACACLGRGFDEQLHLAVQRRLGYMAPRTVPQFSQNPAYRLESGLHGKVRHLLVCTLRGLLCVRGRLCPGLLGHEVGGRAGNTVLGLGAVVRGGRIGAGQQLAALVCVASRDGSLQAREQLAPDVSLALQQLVRVAHGVVELVCVAEMAPGRPAISRHTRFTATTDATLRALASWRSSTGQRGGPADHRGRQPGTAGQRGILRRPVRKRPRRPRQGPSAGRAIDRVLQDPPRLLATR
ncbi:hypothetical protein [Streptomyces chartreusis]|uniref:hypothetical protein n=1 Tax=Streptomyces chartreusis TaxID=1969 RepID=UPI0037D4BBDD